MTNELLFLVSQLTKELESVANDIDELDNEDNIMLDIRRAVDILNKVNAATEEDTNAVESCFKPRLEWVFNK